MTTVNLPKSIVYGAVCFGFRPDVRALGPGVGRELAPRLLHPGASRGFRDRDLRTPDHAAPARLLPRPDDSGPARGAGHGRVLAALHPGDRHGTRRGARPADDRRRGELPAARRALLHPGRQPDEHRRGHRAHLQLRRGAGRLDEGRARPGEHPGLGDLLRHVGHGAGRCRRPRHDRDQGHEGPWLHDRVRRRRHGRFGHPRADHPAVPALRDLRHDGQRLDRRALPGRPDPRPRHDADDDGDGGLLRPPQRLGQRHAVLVDAARRSDRSKLGSSWPSRSRSG